MKYILSISMALMLLGCNAQQSSNNDTENKYADVSNAEAIALMENHPNLQIIDVRTDGEVAAGMIKGAKQLDISKANFETELKKEDKSAPVLVYCASGGRSKQAQNIMKEQGFEEVYNLANGYNGWEQ